MAFAITVRRGTNALVVGFVAGFVAVLVFHQGIFTLLHALGVVGATPFSSHPVPPWGVPQIWSQSFWGGVWGIVFVLAQRGFPHGVGYWVACFLFGAIALTAVAWFIVAPLKGLPLGMGFSRASLIIGPLVNGAWGLGTGFMLRWHGSA